MKSIKLLISVGLLLNIGIGLNAINLQNIEDKINSFDPHAQSDWKSSGPTEEDIMAGNKVNNFATKGSREESIINAAKNGDHQKITTLIAAGANLEAKDNQDRTALMRAAEEGYFDIVKILLDAGADVSTKDKFGWTALFIATDKNHVEVVKILIERGAFSDKNFEDIFVSSVFKGNVEMVKALVGDGTHMNSDIIDTASGMAGYGNKEMVNIIENLKSQCNSSETND